MISPMKQIMVVDDDEDLSSALKLILEDEGFVVTVYSQLKDLYQALNSEKPSLLILDYWLPDGKGIDAARSLRQNPAFENLPILMISAKDTIENEALNTGITSFLAKPFSINTLIEKVTYFVG